MKNATSKYNLVYDWNKSNLRNVINRTEAIDWYNWFSGSTFKKYSFVLNTRTSVSELPILEKGEIITKKFNKFLKENKSMSDSLKLLWTKFLKEFDVLKDWDNIWFKERDNKIEDDDNIDSGIFKIKEFVLGLFRLTPAMILDRKKTKNKWEDVYKEYYFSQHMDKHEHAFFNQKYNLWELDYNVKNKKYTTPIYWLYASTLRTMMFWGIMEFEGGRLLQKWQQKAIFNMAEETYIAASRGAGKSFLAAHLASMFMCRSVIDPREKIDWSIVHYYGISHDSNKPVIQKILTMNRKLMGSKLFVYNSADKIMYFKDNGVITGQIKFLSDMGIEAGRWDRPNFIIVDEAAKISDNVMKILEGNSFVPKIYISTIDYETKKNWFYEGLTEAEIKQNEYDQTMEELLNELWIKYGMDKVKNLEELDHKAIVEMRQEFFIKRPVAGMRFTLDDVEYKSDLEKQSIVDRVLSKFDKKYLLAEHYAEYLDEESLFTYEKCIVDPSEYPEVKDCEMLVFGYDKWWDYDSASLCVAWMYIGKCYIYESIILPKDKIQQIDKIKEIDAEYRLKNNNIYYVVDVTQAKYEQKEYVENRGITVDMAIVITASWEHNMTEGGQFHKIGKRLFVNVAKEWFKREAIQLSSALAWDKWLLDELKYFQKTKTSSGKVSYEATKGKDDQVLSMLYCYYYMYINGIKEEQASNDSEDLVKHEMGNMDYYDFMKLKEEQGRQGDLLELAYDDLFGNHWF